ncbi:hypothetical protein C8Q75DRAFT_808800 [Abortiporus biennis]|nr:hypothetical protein C8Q75DRAFT_808800 [Abortiporus biennis]
MRNQCNSSSPYFLRRLGREGALGLLLVKAYYIPALVDAACRSFSSTFLRFSRLTMIAVPQNNIVSPHILPRDDGGGKLSTPSIIGIAIACGKATPLPPVQALSHHREQQLSALEFSGNRPTTWVDLSPSPHHLLHSASSDVSLLTSSAKRKSSFYTDEGTTAESASSFPSPLSISDPSLPPPHPTFFGTMSSVNTASSSTIHSDHSGDYTSPSPSPSTPHSENTSAVQPVFNRSPLVSQLPSRPVSRSRSRPVSMVSMTPSHSYRPTIRGAPHGPLSNVQIVLPTPLAPQVYPFMNEGRASNYSLGHVPSARSSMLVDQWVMPNRDSASDTGHSTPSAMRRTSWNSSFRHSTYAPSSFNPSGSPHNRRSRSQPRTPVERDPRLANSSSTSLNGRSFPDVSERPGLPRVPSAPLLSMQQTVDEHGRSSSSHSGSITSSQAPSSEIPDHLLRSKSKTLRKPKPANVS